MTDATQWAIEAGLVISGAVMFNTAILGGFSKATGLIGMESIEKALRNHFKGDAGEKNVLGARLACEGTIVSRTTGNAAPDFQAGWALSLVPLAAKTLGALIIKWKITWDPAKLIKTPLQLPDENFARLKPE